MIPAWACSKKTYTSAAAAKWDHRYASFSLRVYWCLDCRGYHVANKGKRQP